MKTDRILNDLYEKKESIGNLTEAMQETAIQYQSWVSNSGFSRHTNGLWYNYLDPNAGGLTDEQLFTIFNNEE